MQMKRKIFVSLILLISAVGILNIPDVGLAIMIMTNDREYKQSNYHYSGGPADEFSVWSRKGYEDVVEQFEKYKKQENNTGILYRNFKPDWSKVWRWYFYLSENRYKLPYREIPGDAYRVSRGVEDY